MLPDWLRSWYTARIHVPRDGTYFAYCPYCLSVLEVGQDGRLLAADARETARWRQVVRDQVADLESQTAALMEGKT